jgi:hypothetical protein
MLRSGYPFEFIEGLEPSFTAVKIARSRFADVKNVTIHQGYAHEITGGPYDLVVATMVWEHIPDPYTALLKVHDHQPKGGVIALQVPRYDNIYPKPIRAILWHGINTVHFWQYTKAGIAALAERCGYKVIAIIDTPRVATLDYAVLRIFRFLYRNLKPYIRIAKLERMLFSTKDSSHRKSMRRIQLRLFFLKDSMVLIAKRKD